MDDIIEVSSHGEHERGFTYVWKNGNLWRKFDSWERAMRFAYPDWQPHRDYAAGFGE